MYFAEHAFKCVFRCFSLTRMSNTKLKTKYPLGIFRVCFQPAGLTIEKQFCKSIYNIFTMFRENELSLKNVSVNFAYRFCRKFFLLP